MNFKLLTILCLALSLGSQAQNTDSIPDTSGNKIKPKYYHKSAVALNAGTTGFGLEFAYNLNPKLNLRARAGMLSVSDYTLEYEFEEKPVLIVGNIDVTNLDLVLEYLPFSKSSFKLLGGISYFIDGGGSAQIIYNEDIQYGDITLSKEDIGDITVAMDYSGIAPYLGLGFGRAVPKKRVGLGIEMGSYYAGSPEVTMVATEMLEPTAEAEIETLRNNLSEYKWLPYITLRLAFRL